MTLEREVARILYEHPAMEWLRELRDGERHLSGPESVAALMEHLMALEEAITRVAAAVDRLKAPR